MLHVFVDSSEISFPGLSLTQKMGPKKRVQLIQIGDNFTQYITEVWEFSGLHTEESGKDYR